MRGKLNIKIKHVNSEESEDAKPVVLEVKTPTEKLNAISTDNGYNLINANSEVVYVLQKTSNVNIFTATKAVLNGILIKKNNGWFFEYYEGDKLISEKVEVKF